MVERIAACTAPLRGTLASAGRCPAAPCTAHPQWLRMMLFLMAAGAQQLASSCVNSQMWSLPCRRSLQTGHMQDGAVVSHLRRHHGLPARAPLSLHGSRSARACFCGAGAMLSRQGRRACRRSWGRAGSVQRSAAWRTSTGSAPGSSDTPPKSC